MKKFVPIKLDKMRNFRYGMVALAKIEELIGKPINELDLTALSINDLKKVIYAGLCHEDAEITPDKVLELIDEHSDIATVSEAMGKAFEEAFGKNVQRAAERGNGTKPSITPPDAE